MEGLGAMPLEPSGFRYFRQHRFGCQVVNVSGHLSERPFVEQTREVAPERRGRDGTSKNVLALIDEAFIVLALLIKPENEAQNPSPSLSISGPS
jgi:hypothetical protein